jgi:hypothetical protein
MAWLCRSVTGLTWSRFARAHAAAFLLALLVGGAAMAGAEAGRAAHLSKVPILIAAGLMAVLAAAAAAWLRPSLFLGHHGTWAYRQVEGLLRFRSRRVGRPEAAEADGLAPLEEANSK